MAVIGAIVIMFLVVALITEGASASALYNLKNAARPRGISSININIIFNFEGHPALKRNNIQRCALNAQKTYTSYIPF